MTIKNREIILACIDGSDYSSSVADYAAWVSQRVDAPLTLLHNIERRDTPVLHDFSGNLGLGSREELLEELTNLEARRSKILLEQGKAMLQASLQRAQQADAVNPTTLQRHGSLLESLIDMEEAIRVVVVGIRGEAHQDNSDSLGAQLESIIRTVQRPVLVINRPFATAPQRLMIAYDGSEAARKALAMVCQSPLFRTMDCHLVTVTSKTDSAALLAEAEQQLQQAGLQVTVTCLEGNVEDSLVNYQQAHQIDLTVMGAFGQNRFRELLLGSVTNRILTRSQVPLLLLR